MRAAVAHACAAFVLVSTVGAHAEDAAKPAQPAAQVSPPESPFVHSKYPSVHFSVLEGSDRPDLTLYMQREVNPIFGPGGSSETGVYEPLCPLPCERNLRPGSYVFGVSSSGGPTIKADRALALHGGEKVSAEYDDRKLVRWAGWAVLIGGVGGGSVMVVRGQAVHSVALITTGSILSVAALVGGLWLANLSDRVRMRIR